MIVRATSDLHGHLPEIEPCDILILGGDICPDFKPLGKRNHWDWVDKGGTQQGRWLDTTFREWLDSIPATHVVAIAGNHDFVFDKRSFLVPKDLRWTYLEDSFCEIEGLRFWGTPWVPGLVHWAFYGTENTLDARAQIIPPKLDVLVTHGPPYLHGDLVPGTSKYQQKYNTPPHGEHVGEHHLNVAINRAHPRAVVCGHIHEGYGHYHHVGSELGVFNVAINDGMYNPVNPVVELPL